MPGIFDLFRGAAELIERVPWQSRLLAGAAIGGAYGATSDNPDLTFGEKVGKGLFLGATAGFAAGMGVRMAGKGIAAGERIGRATAMSKVAAIRARGFSELLRPGSLMVGGALAGAIIAPPGSRGTGAMIGAGIGLAARPARAMYRGYERLGRIPGAQTGVLLAGATGAVVAGAAIGEGTPEGTGVAVPGIGGTIDYEPMSGNMQDRMFAMNATGDIVLGLHNRQHGG